MNSNAHIGHKNNNYKYTMQCTNDVVTLDVVQEERDLGVNFDPALKFSRHSAACSAKASKILGIVKRTFTYLEKDIFLPLYIYKSLISPHLEYATWVWKPWFVKTESAVKSNKTAGSWISQMAYSDRLKGLGLPTLQYM